MQEIEIIITKDGKTKLEPKNFTGGECLKVTEELEKRLGQVESRDIKPEMYQQQSNTVDAWTGK